MDKNKPYLFKKGKSGNPGGRPKGIKSIKAILDKFGEWDPPELVMEKILAVFPKAKNLDMKEAVYLNVYILSLKGEQWATEFIADRTEGKALQTVKTEGPLISNTIVADQATKDNLDKLGDFLNGGQKE